MPGSENSIRPPKADKKTAGQTKQTNDLISRTDGRNCYDIKELSSQIEFLLPGMPMDEIKSPNSSSGTLAPTGKKPRKLRRAIFILLAFFGVAFLTVFAAYLLNYYRVQKAWEPYIKQAEQFEREYVIYSGKTPQEVYEKFVVYLKAGDIETASKYYSRKEDQIRQSEYLTKLRAENRLEEYIADLPKWQDMHEEEHWDPSAKKFIYEYVREQDEIFYDELIKQNRTIPAGQYEGELEFYYVAPVGVWKIRL